MQHITPPELNEGEIYGGAIINPDGTGHHVIKLPGELEEANWDDAMKWAAEQGGDLPNRVEQALLYDKSKAHFKEKAYWSNQQHASYSDYAWYQNFGNGLQFTWGKATQFHACAVRRLVIE